MGEHSIRVVTLLSGDEFLLLQHMADDDGLSDSAYLRRLIKLDARRRAMDKVSSSSAADQSAEPAQVVRSAFHA